MNDDYKRDIRLEKGPPRPPYPTKRPSRFLLFILSVLPGLGHMYMGLIKRGLFYLSALALIIFLTVNIAMVFPLLTILTGFAIAALYAVSFFETFKIRREFIMGIEVKDAIPNFGSASSSGGKKVLILLAVILVIAIGINILAALPWYAWIVIGIIALGVIGLNFGKKPPNGN